MVWETYLVQADRQAGYQSHILLRDAPQARYLATLLPDVKVLGEREGIAPDSVHWAALQHLFLHGDINVAYFDVMFFGPSQAWANRFVLKLMKTCGIRIIVMAHGGDVTYRTRYRSRFDWIGRVQANHPLWDLETTAPATLQRIHTYCEVADLVLPGDSSLVRQIPRNDLLFKFFPIDTGAVRDHGVSSRSVPVIVHAPTARSTKGTDYFLAAIERLAAKGIRSELRLIEKMPRGEALEMYADADIVADQLCIGAYGTLSLESLAMGKPTLTYLDQEHLGDPIFNLPVVNTTPENVEPVLAVLLQVPELRRRLSSAARKAMEMYQSIDALAEVWDQIYRKVWRGEALRLEVTRHFSPSRTVRSFVEDPADMSFWPVPVDDLADDIARALAKAK